MTLFFSQTIPKKTLSCLTLFLLVSQLIIGGILLPYRQVQAVTDIIGGWAGWSNIGDFVMEIYNGVKEYGATIYDAAGTWSSAAVDAWNKSETIRKDALKATWEVLRRTLLQMLVNDIIAWINGEGKPKFVTDWEGYLKNAADTAAGHLIDKMGLGFLCDNFSFQLRLALSSPPDFSDAATCTLSEAIANLNNFMTDFSQGGWRGWAKISESKNNYMGAYFTALDEKYAVMSAAADAAKNEAVSSSGFLGDKVCRKVVVAGASGIEEMSGTWKQGELPSGADCLQWETRTPGRIAADSLSQAVNIDIPWLINAKEWQEYAGAIIDAVINRAIREGVAAMTSSSAGTSSGYGVSGAPVVPGVNAPVYVSVNISSYDDANTNSAEIVALDGQQKLLKENLETLLAEQEESLNLLYSIRVSQNSSLSILTNFLQNNCALPSGVSVNTIAGTVQVLSTCSGLVCPCTATTVERVRLSAPGTGEAILEKTTTQRYEMTTGFCEMTQTTSYTTLSTTAAVESEITTLNTDITDTQDELSKTIFTNIETQDYVTSANAYVTIYETWRNGDLSAATSTAETTMYEDKENAIDANQTTLPSSSVEFANFTQETMQKSNSVVGIYTDSLERKGGYVNCEYYSSIPASLYRDVCAAQATTTSYQNSLNTCLATSHSTP